MPSSPRHPAEDGRVDYLLVDYGLVDREPWDFSQALTAALSFAGSFVFGRNYAKGFTAALSFSGSLAKTANKAFAASVSPAGGITRSTAKGFTAALSFSGSQTKQVARSLAGTLSFSGSLGTQLSKFLQQQLLPRIKYLLTALRIAGPVMVARAKRVAIKLIGPDVTFKRGTDIEFEATFTDADGNLYDPDVNTVKMQVKKPDGTVYTGWAFTDNKYLSKQSTGVYRVTFQTLVTDPIGTWTFEVQGKVGTYTSLDDYKASVRD